MPIYAERSGKWRVRFWHRGVKSDVIVGTHEEAERLEENGERRLRFLDPGRHRTKLPNAPTFVYFVQHGSDGLIKIGRSEDPATRLASMQTDSPVELRLLVAIEVPARHFETQLHRHFAAHRVHGEWFVPAPELLALISELKAAAEGQS